MYEIIYSPEVQEKLAALKGNIVNVMELYDEREDFARTLFGIVTTTQETLEYWNE